MKKIIFALMLAVSFMAFTACNDITNGNNGNNGAGTEDNISVTPTELLKNIPVTTDDFKNMLGSTNINRSAESDSTTYTPSDSDIILLVFKYCISEVEGFELGKNATIGVIGEFSQTAKNEFLKFCDENYVNGLFESFAVRDFGTAYVNMEGDKVTIFWYMPGWSPDEGTTNFPACKLYANGTYKNGRYEDIIIYGENYHYCYDTDHNFTVAVPLYEKTYINDDKVISYSFYLESTTLSNNVVTKVEATANNTTRTTVDYSDELPTQADIDGYHQKIQDWYSTVNN